MGGYKRDDKSPIIWVITIVILLITPLITNHEPPSSIHRPEDLYGLFIVSGSESFPTPSKRSLGSTAVPDASGPSLRVNACPMPAQRQQAFGVA